MKRTIFFRIFTFCVFVSYFGFLFSSLQFDEIDFYQFWFSAFLVLIGLIFFVRYICYVIDSSLFISVLLFISGVAGILNYYFKFSLEINFSLYIGALGIASLSIFIKFRQIFHLKVFVFAFLCAILLVLFSEKLLPLIAFIVLISITSITILTLIITSIKTNTRKV